MLLQRKQEKRVMKMHVSPAETTAHHEKVKCGHPRCLGPLGFHKAAKGDMLSLRMHGRYAERDRDTYLNGLAFSSRPVHVRERVHMRVERCDQHWEGTMRVGFTSTPPTSSPPSSIVLCNPHQTAPLGYWACALPDSHTGPGARLCFWVTPEGVMKYKGPDGGKLELIHGLDVSKPLWAMVDVYGQTRAVLLLRSEIRGCFKRTSCPVPLPPVSRGDSCMCVAEGHRCRTPFDYKLPSAQRAAQRQSHAGPNDREDCVVCLSAKVCVTLPCGHRCLCSHCAGRILSEFDSCPLCRLPFSALNQYECEGANRDFKDTPKRLQERSRVEVSESALRDYTRGTFGAARGTLSHLVGPDVTENP